MAEQHGEQVVLRWTLPALHTDGTRVTGSQQIEIHRWFAGSSENLSERFGVEAQLIYVIPADVASRFEREGKIEFADPLGPRRLAEQAGRYAVYGIKVLNRKDEAAAFSNLVAVRVYPVPTAVAKIETEVSERAIRLRWTPPSETTSRTPVPAIAGYRVYRGPEQAEKLQPVTTVSTTDYTDTNFRFGETIYYRVRAVAQYGEEQVEGVDSAIVSVTPQDVFAPPTPENLTAIASRGRVDLTWDASPAADLAGYVVYRAEQPEDGYRRLNPEAVVVQSFGDTGVAAGKTYYYAVTAVDRRGNESARSQSAVVTVPAE